MSLPPGPSDRPDRVRVRRVEFGTEYRVGLVQLVVDDEEHTIDLLIGPRGFLVSPRELRALRLLLNHPLVVMLINEA